MTPPRQLDEARLPRGRHAISREEVRSSQRRRLLRAMTDEVAQRGFAATTAAGVYQRAGVSSRAFYESFRDVRDCFLAAYDESVRVTQEALRPLAAADAGGRPPLARFADMLDAYLRLLAAEPHVARTFLVEVYGGGPQALARRVQVHEQFVAVVGQVLAAGLELSDRDTAALEGVVSAITFQVTVRILAGGLGDLGALREDLLEVARRLCPWLDDEDDMKEMR